MANGFVKKKPTVPPKSAGDTSKQAGKASKPMAKPKANRKGC